MASIAVRYGRYEVLSRPGQGAMAQLYHARDSVLARCVAVKALHAELASRQEVVLQRFFDEAKVTGTCDKGQALG